MTILYIGDIMGQPGIETVKAVLPNILAEYKLDLVIAQAENVTDGRGMSKKDMSKLEEYGVNFFTGGNWSLFRENVLVSDNVIRPANYPQGTPGRGWRYAKTTAGNVLVVSLLGKIVGKDADKPMLNPLQAIDEIIESQLNVKKVATVVNFHGDYSSEKRIIGYYLDGRVTAVIGDHWHVPTADAMVLPKGTAHITDAGMCGTLHSSLGIKLDSVTPRWQKGARTKNELETKGPFQFNAVLVDVNPKTMLSSNIKQIQVTI